MHKVFKYELQPDLKLNLEPGAEVLCVQAQGDKAMMWVLVDPLEPTTEKRRFVCLPTGRDLEEAFKLEPTDSYSYIGTFQVPNDELAVSMAGTPTLVFHVFEIHE
jgi:hypothetical protein